MRRARRCDTRRPEATRASVPRAPLGRGAAARPRRASPAFHPRKTRLLARSESSETRNAKRDGALFVSQRARTLTACDRSLTLSSALPQLSETRNSHEGPHRGGAGKGGWGKPDEAKATADAADADADAPEPEPEEIVNEVSIDDYEKAKAEKKAAIAAMMKKGDSAAKVVDESAFASMKLGGDAAPENQFGLANGGAAKAKRERERAAKEKSRRHRVQDGAHRQ